jgi:alpha-1,3-rhamnosyltransferase
MNSPFVTIGVPVWNHERYVAACLESAAAQTYANLDLVIIDDGSSDNSLSIVETFIAGHRRRFRNVHLASRPHRGLCANFNEVVSASKTDWICLTGSDDVMYPDRVSALVAAAREWQGTDVALICGRADWIDAAGEPIASGSIKPPAPGLYKDFHLDLLLTTPVLGPVSMMRRDAILSAGGFDESLPVEDFQIWLKLSVRHPLGIIDRTIGAYRRHLSNHSSAENTPLMYWGMLLASARFLDAHGDCVSASCKRRLLRKSLMRAFRCLRYRRPHLALGLLPEILRGHRNNSGSDALNRYAGLVQSLL